MRKRPECGRRPQNFKLFKLGFSIGVVLQLNQIHETFLHGEQSCEMRVGKAEKSFKKFLVVEALRSDLSSFPTHLVPLLSQMRTLCLGRAWWKVKRKRRMLDTETPKEILRHRG